MVLTCKRLEGLKISFKRQNDFMKKIFFFLTASGFLSDLRSFMMIHVLNMARPETTKPTQTLKPTKIKTFLTFDL